MAETFPRARNLRTDDIFSLREDEKTIHFLELFLGKSHLALSK